MLATTPTLDTKDWIAGIAYGFLIVVGLFCYYRSSKLQGSFSLFFFRPISLRWFDSSIQTFHAALLLAVMTHGAIFWLAQDRYKSVMTCLNGWCHVAPDAAGGGFLMVFFACLSCWMFGQAAANGAISIIVSWWAGDPRKCAVDEIGDVKKMVKDLADRHDTRSKLLVRIVFALESLRSRQSNLQTTVFGVLSTDSELCAEPPDPPDTLVFIHEQKRWAEDVAPRWAEDVARCADDPGSPDRRWFINDFCSNAQSLNEAWQGAINLCMNVLKTNHRSLGIDGWGADVQPVKPCAARAIRFIFGRSSQLEGIKENWQSNLALWGGRKQEDFYSLWPRASLDSTSSEIKAGCLNILLPCSARTAPVRKWLDGEPTPEFYPLLFERERLLSALVKEGITKEELLKQLKIDEAHPADGESRDRLYVGSIVALKQTNPVDESKICGLLRYDLLYFLMLLHHKQSLLFPEFLWWLLDPFQTPEISSIRLADAKKWMEQSRKMLQSKNYQP